MSYTKLDKILNSIRKETALLYKREENKISRSGLINIFFESRNNKTRAE